MEMVLGMMGVLRSSLRSAVRGGGGERERERA